MFLFAFLMLFLLKLFFNIYKSPLSTSILLYFSILSLFSSFSVFSHHVYQSILLLLLYSPVGTLLWLCFPAYALVSFVFNWLISFCFLFAHQVNLFFMLFFFFFWTVLVLYMCVCVCVYTHTHTYIFHFLKYLPDFVFAFVQDLHYVFCFSFNFLQSRNKPPRISVGSQLPGQRLGPEPLE